jgi:hypothetical protein
MITIEGLLGAVKIVCVTVTWYFVVSCETVCVKVFIEGLLGAVKIVCVNVTWYFVLSCEIVCVNVTWLLLKVCWELWK